MYIKSNNYDDHKGYKFLNWTKNNKIIFILLLFIVVSNLLVLFNYGLWSFTKGALLALIPLGFICYNCGFKSVTLKHVTIIAIVTIIYIYLSTFDKPITTIQEKMNVNNYVENIVVGSKSCGGYNMVMHMSYPFKNPKTFTLHEQYAFDITDFHKMDNNYKFEMVNSCGKNLYGHKRCALTLDIYNNKSAIPIKTIKINDDINFQMLEK